MHAEHTSARSIPIPRLLGYTPTALTGKRENLLCISKVGDLVLKVRRLHDFGTSYKKKLKDTLRTLEQHRSGHGVSDLVIFKSLSDLPQTNLVVLLSHGHCGHGIRPEVRRPVYVT